MWLTILYHGHIAGKVAEMYTLSGTHKRALEQPPQITGYTFILDAHT
jgi:hypothetical protein